MQTFSSANRTCSESASAVECTATDADAHLAAGADHAQRDLAAVRYENFLEQSGARAIALLGQAEEVLAVLHVLAVLDQDLLDRGPSASASISFISFMASTMQTTWPLRTACPTSTNAGASGEGAR